MQKSVHVIMVLIALSVSACAGMPQDSSQLKAIETAKVVSVTDGPTTPPPPGFVSFCLNSPETCTGRGNLASSVALSDKTASTLVAVNKSVNDSINYESDEEQYGVANRWTLVSAGGYGDCKAYALAKQAALRAEGLPNGALRIAIVRTDRDELHAVLTVDTDKGVLVLDSLTGEIRPWSDTDYHWLMRQASDNPLRWVTMADGGVDGIAPLKIAAR